MSLQGRRFKAGAWRAAHAWSMPATAPAGCDGTGRAGCTTRGGGPVRRTPRGDGVQWAGRPRAYFAVDLGWLSSTFTVNLPARMSASRALTLATISAGTFFSKVPRALSDEPLCFIIEYGP